MDVDNQPQTPAYRPRLQGNAFQRNEIQGIDAALRQSETLESGIEPSSRYFFRPQKRSVESEEAEEHQAKRVRAMIALTWPETEEEDRSDSEPEFALAATMPITHAFRKKTREGIFERIYALLCRQQECEEDYAFPAKVVLGIPIPRSYHEAMRGSHSKQ